MEAKLDEFIDVVNRRFASLEVRIHGLQSDTVRQPRASTGPISAQDFEHIDSHDSGSHVASSSAPVSGATGTASPDIQGEYQSIRDALARIQLPADLKLNDSRQGIRRADQPVYNVIAKCGRYNETLLKLLTTIDPDRPASQDTLEQLFVIAQAQGRYLQDEYASLVVSSQFDNNTSKIFRALQKNTSGLNPSALDTLRSAASLAAVSRPAQSGQSRGGFRGRHRGGHTNNRNQDVFQSFTNRSFTRRINTGGEDED